MTRPVGGATAETGAVPVAMSRPALTVARTVPTPANVTSIVPPGCPRFCPPIWKVSAPVVVKVVGRIVWGTGFTEGSAYV